MIQSKILNKKTFNELGLGILSRNQALDQAGQLIPYRRDEYKVGNGKDSIDQLVESKLIHPKFVYLTTTVKNIGKQATEEIYMHPSIQVLKSKGNVWNYAERDGITEKIL